jgi:pilus assembly protein CpaF
MPEVLDNTPVDTAVARVFELLASGKDASTPILDKVNAAITEFVETQEEFLPLEQQRLILRKVMEELGASPRPLVLTGALAVETAAEAGPVPPTPKHVTAGSRLLKMADEISQHLLRRIDFAQLGGKPPDQQGNDIRNLVEVISAELRLQMNHAERELVITMITDEMLGLGPLEPLLADESITDIMINGADQVFVERRGRIERSDVVFRNNTQVMTIANRIVSSVGRRIDESSPLVDARLADGSRVHVVIPPLALDGPVITIRKFPERQIGLKDLVQLGSLSDQMAEFLALAARMRLNILISGGTGSGKTTLLNAMSQLIAPEERIVTIEDTAELRLQIPHVVRLETRPPTMEGSGEVTMRMLVKNALRMRPDRIILGEVRGDEVLDLLQAMNTGHDGSMSTLHANTARDALTRVEHMVAMSGVELPIGVVRSQIRQAVSLIIQVNRMRDGRRRVTSVSELVGINGGVITMQEIFVFRFDGATTQSEIRGSHEYTGFMPGFIDRAREHGLEARLRDVLSR